MKQPRRSWNRSEPFPIRPTFPPLPPLHPWRSFPTPAPDRTLTRFGRPRGAAPSLPHLKGPARSHRNSLPAPARSLNKRTQRPRRRTEYILEHRPVHPSAGEKLISPPTHRRRNSSSPFHPAKFDSLHCVVCQYVSPGRRMHRLVWSPLDRCLVLT